MAAGIPLNPRSAEAKARSGQSLKLGLVLTASYMVAEIVGSILTGSLALLADAGHMFTDAVATGLGLFAWMVSERAPTSAKTFGYYRVEILVGLANGLALWGVVFFVAREARRSVRRAVDRNASTAFLVTDLNRGAKLASTEV